MVAQLAATSSQRGAGGDRLAREPDQRLVADDEHARDDRGGGEQQRARARRSRTAATVLAQNSCARLVERVSTVFQVPCWSSLAKMSPATIAVSSGSTHWAAKPRTSRASAKPFSVANRPKRVSLGGRDWPWMTTTIGDRRERRRRAGQRLGAALRAQLADLPAQRGAEAGRGRAAGRVRVGAAAAVVVGRRSSRTCLESARPVPAVGLVVGEHEEQRLQRRLGSG